MDNKQSQDEIVKQIYAYALNQKKLGKSNKEIQDDLMSQGVDEEGAKIIVENIDKASKTQTENKPFPKWLIYILILILINVLSAVFGWGFWIY